jgi:hypothetical protein
MQEQLDQTDAMPKEDHSFVAYIDESGDDGLGNFRSPGTQGSTHWFTISCCVVRRKNDLRLVEFRDEILNSFRSSKKREIHFRNLNHEQKVFTCSKMAKMPIVSVSVMNNKTSISEEAKQKFSDKSLFYWYTMRYIIERVSWLCDEAEKKDGEGDGTVKLIFSNRGGLKYGEFQDYLRILKRQSTEIRWKSINIDSIEVYHHAARAGLQFADCVASAFSAAVEPNFYGLLEPRYAEILTSKIYCRKGNYLSYGLKVLPNLTSGLTKEQIDFFERYKK